MVSVAQYKSLKRSKYRSIKCNGKDSKKEYSRGVQLHNLQKLGLINNLQEQVPFVLQEKFIDSSGNLERGIKYIADYCYLDTDKESKTFGRDIIEDVKSVMTKKNQDYIIKRKMLKLRYPQFIFREYT